MKKGKIMATVSGAVSVVFLVASLVLGSVNIVEAQALLSPNNGCIGVPVNHASFSWSPFGEATKYKFVLAKDAAMTQVIKEATTLTTAIDYDGTLEYSTNYFWRVMAIEPAPSDWSATFSFMTEATPPPTTQYSGPQLLAPNNGALIDCDPVPGRSQPVTFSWSPLNNTTKYKFVVSKDEAMTQVVDETEVATTAYGYLYEHPNPLECGNNYFWRVMALEPVSSDWSDTWSLQVKPIQEQEPTYYGVLLLAPSNGCLGVPVRPVSFSWSPFKETTKYKFVLAKDAAMTQVIKEATTLTTAIDYDGTLEYSTNYFWRVIAIEPAPSDWSATFSFTTEAAPASWHLLSPSNGSIGVPVNHVSFSWSPFGLATKYKFDMAKDAAMTQIVKEAEVLTTAYEYDGRLDYSTNYFWRVIAVEPAPSGWSPVFSFGTEAAPASWHLLSPSNGSIGVPVNHVSFSWSPFGVAIKYEFVLAKDAAMTRVVQEADVTAIDFKHDGALEYGTNYFWRVRAIEPALSDWSPIFVFRTELKSAVAPPVSESPTGPTVPSPTRMSCSKASVGHNVSPEGSPFLFVALLFGLAIASRIKRSK